MAGISFGGLATGLDTNAIIKQLMALETRPLARLTNKRGILQTQQADFSTFRSKLQDLADRAKELGDVQEISKFTGVSSNEDALDVSASGLAQAGSHTLVINSLASAKTGYTTSQADKDTTGFGSGTIDLTVDGTTYNVAITAGQDDTLEGIRDAINNTADLDVQASIINDGAGYRLVLSSSETGTANAYTVATTGLNATGTGLFTGFTETAATDASFDLDGIAITSSSNAPTDVLEGVTLNLKDVSAAPITFSVERDLEAIGDKLQEFVDSYNDALSYIDSQSSSDDVGMRTIKRQLTSTFQNLLSSASFNYVGLSQVGITTTAGGKATLDRDDLETAINTDFSAYIEVFAGNGTDDGFSALFEMTLEGDVGTPGILSTGNGLLQVRQDGLGDRIRSLDRQILNQERRLDRIEENLVRRFASFEGVASGYQAQGQFIQQALSGLGG